MLSINNDSHALNPEDFPTLSERKLKQLSRRHLHRQWLESYLRFRLFIKQFGRFPYQIEQNPKGFRIGAWMNTQRVKQKIGKLPLWRYELLSALDFNWGAPREEWDSFFERAKLLQERKGAPLSKKAKSKEEQSLKCWVYRQVKLIKRNLLDENKIKLLKESGLLVDVLDQHWNVEFGKVAEFIKKYNRLPSAHSRDPEENSLGTWRLFQTQRYKKGLISKTKGRQLDSLGLANRIMDNLWNDNFEKARNIIVPRLKAGQLYGPDGLLQSLGKELYTWWDNNRRKYFCGKLNKDRMRLFEKYKMTLRVCELNKIYKKPG